MKINIKKCLSSALFLALLFSLLSVASSAEAGKGQNLKSILRENFNKYINGPVVGQGGWIDRENGLAWNIQDVLVKEGLKGLSNFNSSGESIITKNNGTAQTDGRQSFYVRTENRSNWADYHIPNVQVGLYQGSWDGTARVPVGFTKDGYVNYIDPINGQTHFNTYQDGVWNLLEIEWRSSDVSARYRLNNGTWTNWIPFHNAGTFTGFDTVGLDGANLGTGGVYIDNLK